MTLVPAALLILLGLWLIEAILFLGSYRSLKSS
jgi:hypothetical protein